MLDLYSRQVVGWSMQEHMEVHGRRFATRRAAMDEVIDWLGFYNSTMSRKGNCWDNAPTESFWGRLKTVSLYGRKFATRQEAMEAVLDWMAF